RDLMAYAERRTRAALGRFTVAGLAATDWMEGDGVTDADLAITVRVDIREGDFHAAFTGTAPAAAGNVNCPLAVTRSAVLFVVRMLLEADVPMNGGVQRAVRVTAPEGCLVNARWPSAVAAGNVETSQRITDAVLLALAGGGLPVPAQGQGTMNNVTLGGLGGGEWGVGWTYYETLGGGRRHGPRGTAGGGDGAPGANLINGRPLRAKTACALAPGDVLRIETPGGGGWGEPQRKGGRS